MVNQESPIRKKNKLKAWIISDCATDIICVKIGIEFNVKNSCERCFDLVGILMIRLLERPKSATNNNLANFKIPTILR